MNREGQDVSDRSRISPGPGSESGASGLRYAKLGYVAINVTDLAQSRHFYETILGLEVSGTGPEGEIFLRCSSDHHNIILYPASRPSLRRLGWQMESDSALDLLVEHVARQGLAPRAVPQSDLEALQQDRSFRITDPTMGVTLEFYARQRDDFSFTPSVAKIQRLGHVVMMSADYEATTRFFLETLNFRASDAIGDRVMFMRCFPNPYHHSFGVANGRMNGLHHINFMVSEIDDVGKAIWRFQKNDVEIVYGPGRHPPSNSVFLYANDPDGITCEYSYGMEEFPEVGARPPRTLPQVQESSDTWGAPPPRIKPAVVEMAEEMDFGAVPIAVG